MILAWVISLLLLCSSLVLYLERLTVVRIIEVKTIEHAQEQFRAAEKAVIECEGNILNLSALTENNCFIQPAGKNQWLISSKKKPTIQVHVLVDEKSGLVTRLNWRQAFE
jgi:hypothetical protein